MSQEVEEIKKHRVPQKLNQLLACRVCALVKDRDQFGDYGCDNCGPALVWSTADVVEMTTSSFSGTVAMLRPSESWVAKWQFMKKSYVPGLYAIEVTDRITASEARESRMNFISTISALTPKRDDTFQIKKVTDSRQFNEENLEGSIVVVNEFESVNSAMERQELEEIQAVTELIAKYISGEAILSEKKLEHCLAVLKLGDGSKAGNIDLLCARLHSVQYTFNALYRLADLQKIERNPSLYDSLLSIAQLANGLFENVSFLAFLVTDLSLPRRVNFAICRCIRSIMRPNYTSIAKRLHMPQMKDAGDNFFAQTLVPTLTAILTPSSAEFLSTWTFISSNMLQVLLSLLKSEDTDDCEAETGNSLQNALFELFRPGESLAHLYSEFRRLVVHIANEATFSSLAPLIIALSKQSIRRQTFSSLEIPSSSILAIFLISNDDEEDKIRDFYVSRKLFTHLHRKLDIETWEKATGDEIRSEESEISIAEHFSFAGRAISLLFTSISATKGLLNISEPNSKAPLISRGYKQDISNSGEEIWKEPGENDALRRAVVLYTLHICGKAASCQFENIDSAKALQEMATRAIVSLARILAGKGLFAINPTPLFFELFGDHDLHLLESLYWLQLLLCSFQPGNSTKNLISSELVSKVPQLTPFLSVLNPYTLFVAFISFLKHDHSALLDFMLSTESEKFLRYILDFTKICLSDWNRTFFTLYSIKTKNLVEKSDEEPISSKEVDDLLERLLQKQMEELALEGEKLNTMEEDEEIDTEEEEADEHIESLLENNAKFENEFDATISTLIRFRIHLENAFQHNLLAYNVNPLLSRLREIETNYEKQGEE